MQRNTRITTTSPNANPNRDTVIAANIAKLPELLHVTQAKF